MFIWTSPSRQPLAGSSSSSSGCIMDSPGDWRRRAGRPRQSWLRKWRLTCGQWISDSDGETTRPGQIGVAATCGNGYVLDKLPKRERESNLLIFQPCKHGFMLTCNPGLTGYIFSRWSIQRNKQFTRDSECIHIDTSASPSTHIRVPRNMSSMYFNGGRSHWYEFCTSTGYPW